MMLLRDFQLAVLLFMSILVISVTILYVLVGIIRSQNLSHLWDKLEIPCEIRVITPSK